MIATAALIVAAALMLCGCSISSSDTSQDVQDRLDKLDELKKTIEQIPAAARESLEAQASGAFRDVPYGSSRDDVFFLENQDTLEEFDNAIDFEYVEIFGYQMLPTYWFNANEQMYRGSYYMKTDEEIIDIMRAFLPQLEELFGSALETSYYNYGNELLELSEAKAIAAVSEGNAYFYAWYYYDIIDIELYIEVDTSAKDVPIYEVYVNFTDYTYHD